MKFGSVGAVIAAVSKKDAAPLLKGGSIPIVIVLGHRGRDMDAILRSRYWGGYADTGLQQRFCLHRYADLRQNRSCGHAEMRRLFPAAGGYARCGQGDVFGRIPRHAGEHPRYRLSDAGGLSYAGKKTLDIYTHAFDKNKKAASAKLRGMLEI